MTALLANPKLAIALGALLLIGFMGTILTIQRYQIQTLRLERDQAISSAEMSAQAVESLRMHVERTQKALREEREANARNIRRQESLRRAAESGDDGPVVPALRNVLDGLRPDVPGGPLGPAGGAARLP